MKRLIFFISLFLVIYVISAGVSTIQAQPYPNRPIQLIIPVPAGLVADVTGRLLAEELKKNIGSPVIVINKPGASMTLGTDLVAKSKKDGYTITYTNTSAIIYSRVLNPEIVPYESFKDLEPLGFHLFVPVMIAVQENSPWKTFNEFVEYAKKNPGKIRVSTPGPESIDHFNLEITQSLTGAQFTHIPVKSGAATALIGGHVEATFYALNTVIPYAEAGKLRILLMSKKMPGFTNIPTLTELGYKQDLLSAWFAVYGPAGLPEDVKKILIPAVEKAVNTSEIKAKINRMGFIVDYKSPAELKKLMAEDYERACDIAVKFGLGK
jgi:tripartite-type tricarboxylate transporter receptor subunit TctC